MKKPSSVTTIVDNFAASLTKAMHKSIDESIAQHRKQLEKLEGVKSGSIKLRAISVEAHHVRAHHRPRHTRYIVAKLAGVK